MSLKITCLLQIYKHKLSAMVLDITWRSTASRTIIPERANCDFIMDGSNSQVWLNTCIHAHMHMHAHTHPSETGRTLWQGCLPPCRRESKVGPLPSGLVHCQGSVWYHVSIHSYIYLSTRPSSPCHLSHPPSPTWYTLPSQRNQGRAQVTA